jgi:hypothetical protein
MLNRINWNLRRLLLRSSRFGNKAKLQCALGAKPIVIW